MTPCPICQHLLYHTSPPVPMPGARVYCDGCKGWLAWELVGPTGDKERVDPLCPVCGGGMVLRNGRNGKFWGCEDWTRKWPAIGSRPASASRVLEVQEFRLVVWAGEPVDEDAARFSRAWEERQGEYDKIRDREEAREKRYTKWWERGPGLGLDDEEVVLP